MVRIFKFDKDHPSYALKCIAGEMLNLEHGKRIWKCDKKLEDPKPYPRIKLDTCYIIPNLNIGFLYVPRDLIETFHERIAPVLKEMEEKMTEYQLATKMFIQMSAYCSIETPIQVKRIFVKKTQAKVSTTEFQWVLMEFPGDIDNSFGRSSYISSIIYDRDNVCAWEHDVIFFKQVVFDDLMLLANNNVVKLPNIKYLGGYHTFKNNKSNILLKMFMIGYFRYITLVNIIKIPTLKYRLTSMLNDLMLPEYNALKNTNIVELQWDDVKKFNVYSPMAIEPAIDTRYGYQLSLHTTPYDCFVRIPDERYNNDIRYNACVFCGLQLHDTIYGIPANSLTTCNVITRKLPDKKLTVGCFRKMAGEKLDDTISLICVRCMYISCDEYSGFKDTLFKIQHPMSFRKMIKANESKFGKTLELIKKINKSTSMTIETDQELLVINNDQDKAIYIDTENDKDIMKCYGRLTEIIDNSKKEGGECILYIQKTINK